MNVATILGKFRHLLTASPKHWPEFIHAWRARRESGTIPCILPMAQRVMRVPTSDFYESYWFFCEAPEGRSELRFFCEHLCPGDVFFDIGGYRGAYSSAAKAALGSQIRVVAFEPIAGNAAAIRRIIALNQFDTYELVEAALGDGGQLAAEIDGASAMLRSQGATEGAIAAPVSSVSLDRFCEERRVYPTILKLDVDGFELKVLEGARQCLTKKRPRIWIEVHPDFLSAQGTSVSAVADLLRANDYTLQEFTDAHTPTAHISYHLWAEPCRN